MLLDWSHVGCIASLVQFEISDFGFEMQDSSNFKISLFGSLRFVKYLDLLTLEGVAAANNVAIVVHWLRGFRFRF